MPTAQSFQSLFILTVVISNRRQRNARSLQEGPLTWKINTNSIKWKNGNLWETNLAGKRKKLKLQSASSFLRFKTRTMNTFHLIPATNHTTTSHLLKDSERWTKGGRLAGDLWTRRRSQQGVLGVFLLPMGPTWSYRSLQPGNANRLHPPNLYTPLPPPPRPHTHIGHKKSQRLGKGGPNWQKPAHHPACSWGKHEESCIPLSPEKHWRGGGRRCAKPFPCSKVAPVEPAGQDISTSALLTFGAGKFVALQSVLYTIECLATAPCRIL